MVGACEGREAAGDRCRRVEADPRAAEERVPGGRSHQEAPRPGPSERVGAGGFAPGADAAPGLYSSQKMGSVSETCGTFAAFRPYSVSG